MNPTCNKQKTGQDAENQALSFLQQQGLMLVERNYRCRGGEIDLIMQDNDALVFVEVRYRASQQFGGALASVDHKKQMKLIHCAEHYISRNPIARPSRFDVVALSHAKARLEIEWIKDAFQT